MLCCDPIYPPDPHPRRALVLIVQLHFNFLHALMIPAHLLRVQAGQTGTGTHLSTHEFPHPERRLVFATRGMDDLVPDASGSADGEAAADRTQPMGTWNRGNRRKIEGGRKDSSRSAMPSGAQHRFSTHHSGPKGWCHESLLDGWRSGVKRHQLKARINCTHQKPKALRICRCSGNWNVYFQNTGLTEQPGN